MTPERPDPAAPDDAENGVLADTGTIRTTGFGLLGTETAQIRVVVPDADDEDLSDATVTADEVAADFEPEAVADATVASVEDDDPDDEGDAIHDGAHAAEEQIITGEVVVEPIEDLADHADTAVTDGRKPTDLDVSDLEAPLEPRAPLEPAGPVEPEAPLSATGPLAAAAPPASPAPATGEQSAVPATRRRIFHPEHDGTVDRLHESERVHPPRTEVAMTSRRIGEFEAGRESADLLTADRLLDLRRIARPEPEGGWQHFVYRLSGRRINLGDGRRARARKELDRRIAAPLIGGAKFVPVLSRKGGVGKTTVTTLVGMALADAREDRVIAVDANPDRGTLAERISRPNGRTVRDLVRRRNDIHGFHDLSAVVSRDETRLDVLASDADPRVSEAFSDRDYHDVASIAAQYYSIVLTDTGTGIVHSVMGATLDIADQLIVIAGLSVDEARLASETLTWLETNGYADKVQNAVVVLNSSRPGAPLVRGSELEAHFRTRARAVVTVPYDPAVAAGSAIVFRDLQPETREAARRLAAEVVAGLKLAGTAA